MKILSVLLATLIGLSIWIAFSFQGKYMVQSILMAILFALIGIWDVLLDLRRKL